MRDDLAKFADFHFSLTQRCPGQRRGEVFGAERRYLAPSIQRHTYAMKNCKLGYTKIGKTSWAMVSTWKGENISTWMLYTVYCMYSYNYCQNSQPGSLARTSWVHWQELARFIGKNL